MKIENKWEYLEEIKMTFCAAKIVFQYAPNYTRNSYFGTKNIWKKISIVKYIFMPKNHKNINFELKFFFWPILIIFSKTQYLLAMDPLKIIKILRNW